jgi:hypothetical protein
VLHARKSTKTKEAFMLMLSRIKYQIKSRRFISFSHNNQAKPTSHSHTTYIVDQAFEICRYEKTE